MHRIKFTCLIALWLLLSLVPHARANGEIGLVVRLAPGLLDAEALRAAIEAELQVKAVLRSESNGPTLQVEAEALSAVRVSFSREPGHNVSRTLDVSAQAEHAAPVIALLATNLVRDEAGELLAQLTAANAAAVVQVPPPPPPPPPPPLQPPAAEPVPTWHVASGCRPNGLRQIPVGADFVPYVGMSMRDGMRVERRLSFNLLGGITGAVRGVELGGFFNLEGVAVCGAQLSGSLNFVMGDVTGAQLSMMNVATGSLLGAQLSLLNIVGADLVGAQLGLLNFARLHVQGAQVGLLNVDTLELEGAQVGLLNVTIGTARGAQVGLLNVTTGRAGTLVGLVNVAEDADAAFGLLNVLWKGRAQLDVWGSDAGLAMVGLTQGARLNHNIFGIGIRPSTELPMFAGTVGLGFRVSQSRWLSVDIDAVSYVLTGKNSAASSLDFAFVHQLRLPITLYLLPGIGLFIAPSLSVSAVEHDSSLQKQLALFGSTRLTAADSQGWVVRIWPGASIGIRLF
jgi:hypothetical protein